MLAALPYAAPRFDEMKMLHAAELDDLGASVFGGCASRYRCHASLRSSTAVGHGYGGGRGGRYARPLAIAAAYA